ncbi:hypothetical protein [Haloglycomyces albus]|nr:hypothetical protein [Haloglycomyces albus]
MKRQKHSNVNTTVQRYETPRLMPVGSLVDVVLGDQFQDTNEGRRNYY